MNKQTLYIGGWSSRCGNCGKGCDPYEETHDTVLGYKVDDPKGCGVRWTHVSYEYPGPHDMRPDLESL